jgi:hypothetical protein
MPPWDLETTRELVGQQHGTAQLELLAPCLQSIADRQFYAGYHFYEHQRLLRDAIDSKLDDQHILDITLPLTPATRVAMHELQAKVGAHVLACTQSLHAIADTLAHSVYYAVAGNLGPSALAERDIGIGSLVRFLAARPQYADVSKQLSELRDHQGFKYLSALVNHSKHRSIILPGLHVAANGSAAKQYQIKFAAFSYGGTHYPALEVVGFLEPFYSWFSGQIVETGNALMSALRDDA